MASKDSCRLSKKEFSQESVGIYCRISSDKKDQLNSLTSQISALIKCVNEIPQWNLRAAFIDIASFAEEKPHKELDRMVKECEEHNISVILTKSISEFGCDTAEIFDTIRKLKNYGTRILFMDEKIDTDDDESNLMISVLESLIQAENGSVNENIHWDSVKKTIKDSFQPYRRKIYGYAKNNKGNLVIDDKHAEVVRKIYKWYLEGLSVVGIIERLHLETIPSPSGKQIWSKRMIEKILENKKYTGIVALPDAVSVDYSYKLNDVHPGIISNVIFLEVQAEKKKRSNMITDENGSHRSNKKYSVKQHKKPTDDNDGNHTTQTIQSKNELEFVIFCIENLAASLHADASKVYQALNDKSDILKTYIVPEYDALHTQSKAYIINDIMEVMRERGVVV